MTIQKIGFIIGLGVLAIDQLTKALILNIDALDNGVTVLPFFNIVRLKNKWYQLWSSRQPASLAPYSSRSIDRRGFILLVMAHR